MIAIAAICIIGMFRTLELIHVFSHADNDGGPGLKPVALPEAPEVGIYSQSSVVSLRARARARRALL